MCFFKNIRSCAFIHIYIFIYIILDRPAIVRKQRPPLHQFIRALLLKELDERTFKDVFKKLRKLPWKEDPNMNVMMIKLFLKAVRNKIVVVEQLASLVAGFYLI